MRTIYFIVLSVLFCFSVHGYEICGPSINATQASYTALSSVDASNVYIGYWAVGSGCYGLSTGDDVATLCSSVELGGNAFCGSAYWDKSDMDELKVARGGYCWCRRTKVLLDGVLVDSIGQWVLVGVPGSGYTDFANCSSQCAQLCADSVATNANGMRHAIMALPAF